MRDQIQLDQWYEQNGLYYRFNGLPRGTDAVVRGDVDRLTQFVHELDLIYHKVANYKFIEIKSILKGVLETGKAKTVEPIGFGNDRIRLIRRMDDSINEINKEGPLSGSQNYVEVTHNEQYGGKWPVKNKIPNLFVDGNRANMMYKTLTALENIN